MQRETYGTGTIKQHDTVHWVSPWPSNLDQSGHQSMFIAEMLCMGRGWGGLVYSQMGNTLFSVGFLCAALCSPPASGLLYDTHLPD